MGAAGASQDVVHRILKAARTVHCALGPGFVESIYGRALGAELKSAGFQVQREITIKDQGLVRSMGRREASFGSGCRL